MSDPLISLLLKVHLFGAIILLIVMPKTRKALLLWLSAIITILAFQAVFVDFTFPETHSEEDIGLFPVETLRTRLAVWSLLLYAIFLGIAFYLRARRKKKRMRENRDLIESVLDLKCPHCREGDLFTRKGLIVYRDILEMHQHCPVCHQKYYLEQGFWIGALWTSYPIVVLVELPFLITAVLNTPLLGFWIPLALMIPAFIITYPIMLRLGRSIWIHFWVRYNPGAGK